MTGGFLFLFDILSFNDIIYNESFMGGSYEESIINIDLYPGSS